MEAASLAEVVEGDVVPVTVAVVTGAEALALSLADTEVAQEALGETVEAMVRAGGVEVLAEVG